MIEISFGSAKEELSAIQREDLKSLVLRSLRDYVPDASISFVGDGHATKGTKWMVLAHTLESVSSKTLGAIEKGFKVYGANYGNPQFSISIMVEQ
tara:strand:- start:629 stop:913 length:285 start_codon:yes stop_codon:yes gene_type:complete